MCIVEDDTGGINYEKNDRTVFADAASFAEGEVSSVENATEMLKSLGLPAVRIDEAVEKGDFTTINTWMKDHVFAKADIDRLEFCSKLEYTRQEACNA